MWGLIQMGFGYLGAYLVYGFAIQCKDDADRFEDLQTLESRGLVFVKCYGFDDDVRYFLCWKRVFRGGEYWKPSFMSETPQCQHSIGSAKDLLEIEQSFEREMVQKVCQKYHITYAEPKWTTLLTAGMGIY